jgi:2-oxoisovalerate dehydrogenase E2 component (dihydrolipoyl transacylase)
MTSSYTVKLPDVGEGVAEAELVEWHVSVGDSVTPDTVLAEVLTDKATVEIFPPVPGVVAALHGEPGDTLAVGGALVTITTDATPTTTSDTTAPPAPPASTSDPALPFAPPEASATRQPESPDPPDRSAHPPRDPIATPPREGVLAAPAVRTRANQLGIDLAGVPGSGAGGQVTHADLDRVLTGGSRAGSRLPTGGDGITVEPVRGLRRKISERLTAAWTAIPHITYVDAVDVTEVEALRTTLNADRSGAARLTLLPFIARAIVGAVADQPRLNAHYDAAASTLSVFDAVHIGVATQTPDGLTVPVVRHAEARQLDDLAAEISRLAQAARDNKATREELSGSSITITSLGALGGLVTTPILNSPEVAIVGINKIETRPVWRDGAFVPRPMFNVSASFDHRIVDGWDAATFVQRIKQLLEQPALLFLDG